jgi:cysteine desulfurase
MRIYLDHNATTPVRPEVVDAMTGVLRAEFGNPSSVYEEGAAARTRVEAARTEVARLVGAKPLDVRFTAGATEANNTLLFGLLGAGDHVVTSTVEHPSIDEPLARLERGGVAVTRVPCDGQGCVSAEAVAQAIREDTKLVSIIWANNETGALQPVEEVAALARERDVLMHSDATQALGKAPVDLSRVPLDFLSASAHKLGGPKGAGALVARGDRKLPAYLQGGGQERGLRGGTENVAGIVGFGVACGLAEKDLSARVEANRDLRNRLWRGLQSEVGDVRWNGDPERLLSNTLNVEFEGLPGEVLVQALDLAGVAVSAGAACHSGSIEPSKVLTAMGRTPEQARASLRLSVGWGVDASQVDRAVALLAELIPKIRSAEAP